MNEDDMKEKELNGLRSFLQRSEVRLSTMHRVAGSFLSGAGLLLLFPVFFKDAVLVIAKQIATLPQLPGLPLTISTITALGLPLYALYLLIRDIVGFYFTSYHPGFPASVFHPRFVLSGISFSPDEGNFSARATLLEAQTSPNLVHFVLPLERREKKDYDELLEKYGDRLIPTTRLRAIRELEEKLNIEKAKNNAEQEERDNQVKNLKRFYTAFGLAAVMDRSLADEAAKMEASLVRHALALRRLVLRYVKALLMFIWTTIIFLIIASILSPEQNGGAAQAGEVLRPALSFKYYGIAGCALIWHLLTTIVVKEPVRWICKAASKRDLKIVDKELKHFELWVSATSLLTAIPWAWWLIKQL